MKNLNELQSELHRIRENIDINNEYSLFFEIEPSRVIDNDRDLEILENEYRIVNSEKGKFTGSISFKDSNELIYYFLKNGISQMVARTPLGFGIMTEERLRLIMDAQIELMEHAKPEWVDQYRLELDNSFSQNLEVRKKLKIL